MAWQVQEAKQRFSEVLRLVPEEDQIITRHGEEVAAIVDIDKYRRLKQAAQASTRTYPGLFPPLIDGEYADAMETVTSERRRPTGGSRTVPDFG